jgi:circadian clock protein KaiC
LPLLTLILLPRGGERVALFTFDEDLDLYLAKATAFGLDLRSFIRERILRAQQVDPAELSPGQFARLLLNFVERENVRMVIIDSLNGYNKRYCQMLCIGERRIPVK